MTMEPAILATLVAMLAVQVVALLRGRRKPAIEVQCTESAFRRWLQAQRPPLPWFLALPEDEQQALAKLGEEQLRDLCVGIGYAVRDPRAAEAGTQPDGGEDHLLEQLVNGAVSAIAAKAKQDAAQPTGRSFLGTPERGGR